MTDLGTMYPGESITFTCSLDDSSGWSFIWEHNSTAIDTFGSTYHIDSLDYSHSGNYQCKAKRGEDPFFTDKSAAISLLVSGKILHLFCGVVFLLHELVPFYRNKFQCRLKVFHLLKFFFTTFWLLLFFFPELPKPELIPVASWEDVFQDEFVQLLCDAEGDDWSYVWYRNGVQLRGDDDGLEWAEDDSYLNFTASNKHEGEYSCILKSDSRKLSFQRSNGVKIKVYGKPLYFSTVVQLWRFAKIILKRKPSCLVSNAIK